ncbi:hypothetical protein D3C73_806490 [compost metagenome]
MIALTRDHQLMRQLASEIKELLSSEGVTLDLAISSGLFATKYQIVPIKCILW